MLRRFLILILCFSFGRSFAQTTVHPFKSDECSALVFSKIISAAEVIYNDAISGKIMVYKDASLTRQFSAAELKKLGETSETVQYADVLDPEKYHDTIIITPFDPLRINAFEFTYKASPKNALAGQNYLLLKYDDIQGNSTALFYVKPSDAGKYFDETAAFIINYLMDELLKDNKLELNNYRVSFYTEKKLGQIFEKLVQQSVSGKLKAYDLAEKEFTINEVDKITNYCESVVISDSVGDFMMDSTVCHRLDAHDFAGFYFAENWKVNSEVSKQTNLQAIGPAIKPYIGGIELPVKPLFYHNPADVKKCLSPAEYKFLTSILNNALIWKLQNSR